jgi:hypothetical protein
MRAGKDHEYRIDSNARIVGIAAWFGFVVLRVRRPSCGRAGRHELARMPPLWKAVRCGRVRRPRVSRLPWSDGNKLRWRQRI